MYLNTIFFSVTILTISCKVPHRLGKNKKNHPDDILWKQHYEDELSDAMLATDKGNISRFVQSFSQPENVDVLEKLVDSITASEKYMKKIENMDFRLNRLDVEIHEKTNDILKRLTDLTETVRSPDNTEKMDSSLNSIKTDIDKIKTFINNRSSQINKEGMAEGAECNTESTDRRLSSIESQIKSILDGVESITEVISKVNTRDYTKATSRTDGEYEVLGLVSLFRRFITEIRGRKCDCSRYTRVDRSERYPTDCHEIQLQGFNVSGIYKINPDDVEPFYVLCDLTSIGGGWTVIQHRFDGSQDFYKGWSDYKNGFGNLAGEFWLGLEKIYYLTNQKLYEVRIEVETLSGQEADATYSVFTVGPENEGYRISTLGTYRGNAGDSLTYHAGQKFSTFDADNDEWKEGSCSSEHGGAWWYKECDKSNLNGKFSTNTDEHNGQNIYWATFKGPNHPLSKTRIMIRPLPATRPLNEAQSTKDKVKTHVKPKPRIKDNKGVYDVSRARLPYKYDDLHSEGFFPNYT